jgi:VanZ family protein
MRRRRSRLVLAWGAVAACIALILTLSADVFAAEETSRFLKPLLRWLWPDLSREALRRALFGLRKGAHLTEYALLAVLAFRAWWLSFEPSPGRVLALTLALVAGVASADETRQAFSLARTGSPWDVALDLTGGALGLGVALLLQRTMRSFLPDPEAPG